MDIKIHNKYASLWDVETRSQRKLIVPIASQVVLVIKNPPANAGDTRGMGLIPGLERSTGGRNGNSLQYFCPKNYMDTADSGLQSMGLQSQTRLSDQASIPTQTLEEI